VLALLLGTVSSLVLAGLGARSSVFKNTGQLPSGGFLNYSLLRLAGLILLIGPPLGIFVVVILGSGLLTVALVVIPFAAIPPLSLIYWSVRSKSALLASQEGSTSTRENSPWLPVRVAFRECLVLLPVTYSLAFLIGMFLETDLSFLGLGLPPGDPSLGIMISEGRSVVFDVWWLSLLPLGVVSLAAVAFLGIVLPIRRVQKQSDFFVQPNSLVMNYAGFWVRMASIAIDGVAVIFIAIIFGILLIIGLAQNLFVVILIAVDVLYTLVFLGGYKNSLGHRLLRIRVVRSNGERVGLGRSLLRGLLIFSFPIIGVLAIAFSRKRRALYDMLSDTVVVKQRYTQPVQNMTDEHGHPTACPQCGRQTLGDNNFCIECGTELVR